jgi:hypothetical protein
VVARQLQRRREGVMNYSELFWLNVTNAMLGILVVLPLLALLIALLFEIGKTARRGIVFYFRLHLVYRRLADLRLRR